MLAVGVAPPLVLLAAVVLEAPPEDGRGVLPEPGRAEVPPADEGRALPSALGGLV